MYNKYTVVFTCGKIFSVVGNAKAWPAAMGVP